MWITGLSALSPAGPRARLTTLIFHRVLPEPDPLFPGEADAASFHSICSWVKRWFNVLPMDEAVQRLREGSLPARSMVITFDDGYADNHAYAGPILQRYGLTATFFIAVGFLNGGRMWNDTVIESIRRTTLEKIDLRDDFGPEFGVHSLNHIEERRRALHALLPRFKYLEATARLTAAERLASLTGVVPPDDLMMSSDQVRSLSRAGMGIGAHTMTHPILAKLDDSGVRQEVFESKASLEALLDERVGQFAYPNGKPGVDYAANAVAAVRSAGFDAAVSTAWGAATADSDVFQLPRFTPWERSRWGFGLRLARNLMPAKAELRLPPVQTP